MWHVDAEIISLIFMLVIMFDVFKINEASTLKDKLFNVLTVTTACAILADIISSTAMMEYQRVSWWIIQGSLLLYFILTPALSVLWHLYALSVVQKPSRRRTRNLVITVLPFIAYVALVLSNPWNGWMFDLTTTNEYSRGLFFNFLFVMFYGYSLATILLAWMNFKRAERTASLVLLIFPVIAGGAVFLQDRFTGILITGAAFALVLLITYMFLQNRKATRDYLTGLNNRLSFSAALKRLIRGNGKGFVLVVALDDFKLFNQSFGQKKGDNLLCRVADYCVSVSPDRTAYRYGGDIFTIILKKATEREALGMAHKIMHRFGQSFSLGEVGYSISACLGVVKYPRDSSEENKSIISAMDFAIYQAKKSGKGKIAFFDDEAVKQLKRKHDVANAITDAIASRAFEIYLQPIYHLQKKKFLYGEALLRLDDKKLGTLSPSEFVPVAEETGQIVEITYCVLEEVCAFVQENQADLDEEISFSVNFSVVQFMQDDMVEKVKAILERYEVDPNRIKIEITESVIVDSFDEIKTAMKKLNEVGISFALDDYGQGYSNISYLINLPFDFVKLDKSIIDTITADRTFISAMISLFRNLDKIIISEGIETKEQSDILESLSCDAIQGFYYAKPAPMQETLKLFMR